MALDFCSASSRMRRRFALLFVIPTGAISACTTALGPSSVSSRKRRRFALQSSASHSYAFLHASLACFC
jgi:hypothetical protein